LDRVCCRVFAIRSEQWRILLSLIKAERASGTAAAEKEAEKQEEHCSIKFATVCAGQFD
jgi:hypothetical protein